MPFVRPNTGDVVAADHINQYAKALEGSTGDAIPVHLTALNDPTHYALRVRNLDATNSRALLVEKYEGSTLLKVDVNGVLAHLADGSTLPSTWQTFLEEVPGLIDRLDEFAMDDITDTNLTGLVNGDALVYHAGSQEWRRVPFSLWQLTDTDLGTPTNGQVPTYNATSAKWESKAAAPPAHSIANTGTLGLTQDTWVTVLTLGNVVLGAAGSVMVFANVRFRSLTAFSQEFDVRAGIGANFASDVYTIGAYPPAVLSPHWLFTGVGAGTHTVYLQVKCNTSQAEVSARRLSALVVS